jgi:catechol 2,3-dioxygenase-like lactoylglutathione lyase family enzyme
MLGRGVGYRRWRAGHRAVTGAHILRTAYPGSYEGETNDRCFDSGRHHVGLAVPDLEAAIDFFRDALGWKELGRNDAYPAAAAGFITDGSTTLTLWRVEDPATAVPFDRRRNVCLHHPALAVADEPALHTAFEKVRTYPGVSVEFAPGPPWVGSDRKHFIIAMPDGLRLEFIHRS